MKIIWVGILLSLMVAACSHAPKTAESDEKLEIIDAHTHPRFNGKPERTSGIPQTREEYFRQWKEAGVVGAVAHEPDAKLEWLDAAGREGKPTPRDDLRELNVVHCAGVEEKPDLKGIETGLRSGRLGCIKIYLGYVHLWASSPVYQPVYALAKKHGVPVVFHTGDTYSVKGKLKFADPLTIDEVAVDHPDVTFVIAHLGNPWIQSAAEVAYKNPNVYLEASALLIGDLDRMPSEEVDEYVAKPIAWAFGYLEDPSKLMFGTDWPLTNIKSYVNAFKRAIPKKHWKAVFHDNAAKVFKLK